jgi:PadR family transcriptional regulator, regulatory protein PadR
MPRDTLGSFEYIVLSVLMRQPKDAYGGAIQGKIEDLTGKDVSIGALYTTLDRMERKGLVTSQWGEATPQRGGRRKKYYRIEGAGAEAVRRTEVLVTRLGGAALASEAT